MSNISSISIFGFVANWSPFLLTFTILLTILYFLVTTKWYDKFEGGRPLTRKEGGMFVANMVLFYVLYGSPVDLLSHILFSFHMLQMAFGLLLMAPLMYACIPEYLWRYAVNVPVLKQIFAIGKKPLLALVVFAGAFSIYHLPVVLDWTKSHILVHTGVHIILFLTALVVFYPIFNKVEPEEKHMGGLFKMLYIFGIGMLLTPACGLIIFAQSAVYETYTNGDAWLSAMELCVPSGILEGLKGQGMISGPEYFTDSPPRMDQQTGGIIMKVLQEVFFGVMLGMIFYKWYNDEKADEEETTRRSLEKMQAEREFQKQFR